MGVKKVRTAPDGPPGQCLPQLRLRRQMPQASPRRGRTGGGARAAPQARRRPPGGRARAAAADETWDGGGGGGTCDGGARRGESHGATRSLCACAAELRAHLRQNTRRRRDAGTRPKDPHARGTRGTEGARGPRGRQMTRPVLFRDARWPAHSSSAGQTTTFGGRPLSLAGKAGVQCPSPGTRRSHVCSPPVKLSPLSGPPLHQRCVKFETSHATLGAVQLICRYGCTKDHARAADCQL